MKNIFEKFTNQYSLSKTLRFELKPVGKTQQILEDAQDGKEQESIIEVEEKNKEREITIKQISIFDSWKGFTGYFTKFFATRRNFYKNDGTSTALATRIVDQNLKRFCDNLVLFESIKEKG